jgi:hypothetical protein
MIKLSDKHKKALKDYGLAVLASAVTMGVALLSDMAPQYAVVIGAIAAPAVKWASKNSKDYGIGRMSPQDTAAVVVAVTTVIGSFIGLVCYLVKHYLNELKPNSGSSIKDQVNRLEARVDTIIEMLGR